ncbi:hypothetical protein MXB_1181, partial [Myxobolus squamalis]
MWYFSYFVCKKRFFNRDSLNDTLLRAFTAPIKCKPTSLFGLNVTCPDDIYSLANSAIEKSKKAILKIKGRIEDNIEIIEDFDDISNELCKIADWAECVRNVVPNPDINHAAQQVQERLVMHVEELNSDLFLYKKLKKFLENAENLNIEAKITAESLLGDFESSGIHLGTQIKTFLNIQREILVDSSLFLKNCSLKHFTNCTDYAQVKLLNSILNNRAKNAHVLGFNCYSDIILPRTMAASRDTLYDFLTHVASCAFKKFQKPTMQSPALNNLSKISYNEILMNNLHSNSTHFNEISFDNLFNTILELFFDLFGVRLSVDIDSFYYVYSTSIVKILVKDAHFHDLGTFYFDLFEHPSKPDFSCHYTLTGRKSNSSQFSSVYLSIKIPLKYSGGKLYTSLDGASILFHELGHCLHSMLYNGKYQNLSGTRCSTDLGEIPSLLFEKFLTDPVVILKLIPNATK